MSDDDEDSSGGEVAESGGRPLEITAVCLVWSAASTSRHLQILSPGWRSPPTSFLQHLRRSGEPAGGARRGMEVQREELLFLSKRT